MRKPVQTWRRSLFPLALIAFTSLILSGCGRDNKVYEDPVTTDDDARVIDGANLLPNGFFDQSVNQASVAMNLDGSTDTSVALRMVTWQQTNTQQAFNGTGQGNRALLGISQYSGKKLSELGSVSFDARVFAGTHKVELLLVIDLNCNSSDRRVLVADDAALDSDSVSTDSGYRRYQAGTTEEKWKVLGSALTDPSDSSIELVPEAAGSTASSLDALITAYPEACIRNGATVDDEMPRDLTVAGVLLSLGDDTNADYAGAHVNRIEIGSDIYDSSEWSTP